MALEEVYSTIEYKTPEQRFCDLRPDQIYATFNMRTKAYNESVGPYEELNCPICKNKGYILHIRVGEDLFPTLAAERCSCLDGRTVEVHRI